MLEKLESEGETVRRSRLYRRYGRLSDIQKAGLTQSVNRNRFAADIPDKYMEPKGPWFGPTTRARIIAASKDRVEPGAITTYEGLTDPNGKGGDLHTVG
ncbi:MAG: hypothetical protein Ct9H300mP16_03900 [Pseudomonadota bacterium]|nr:MAG: hypothetical protein Ct9H300mP16_03900 [Pseudomonadota bacterium]